MLIECVISVQCAGWVSTPYYVVHYTANIQSDSELLGVIQSDSVCDSELFSVIQSDSLLVKCTIYPLHIQCLHVD